MVYICIMTTKMKGGTVGGGGGGSPVAEEERMGGWSSKRVGSRRNRGSYSQTCIKRSPSIKRTVFKVPKVTSLDVL